MSATFLPAASKPPPRSAATSSAAPARYFIDEMRHRWVGGTPLLIGANPSVVNVGRWTPPHESAAVGAVGINRWAFVWLNP